MEDFTMLTKATLVSAVAAEAGITKKAAAKAVDAVFGAIAAEVSAGNKVTVTGFGTFEPKAREARQGRNPQTGEAITIPAHNVVTFKPGKGLKDCVNE